MMTLTFKRYFILLAFVILSIIPPIVNAHDVGSLYIIGNSLTNDSGPGGLPSLFSENSGSSVEVGYHIRTSVPLIQIWNLKTPSIAGSGRPIINSAYGAFEEGLPHFEWDAITLQIHPRNGATLNNDVAAIVNFVNLAKSEGKNSGTKFYTYAPWPQLDEWHIWDDPAPTPTASAKPAAAYHAAVVNAARDATGLPIGMVPLGEVWNQVRLATLNQSLPALSNGELPEISNFYRDNTHASNLGRFLNGMTLYATVMRNDPTFATVPSAEASYYGGQQMTDELALALQQIIWSVVTSEPLTLVRSLPGDFNLDGIVDAADYTIWRNNLGAPTELALNGNGSGSDGVDMADFDLWKSNFSSFTPPPPGVTSIVHIPEPASVFTGASILLALAIWRNASPRLFRQPE